MVLTSLKQTFRITISVLIVMTVIVTSLTRSASAETIKELQARSQELQSQIDANNSQITELSKQAESLQGKIQTNLSSFT